MIHGRTGTVLLGRRSVSIVASSSSLLFVVLIIIVIRVPFDRHNTSDGPTGHNIVQVLHLHIDFNAWVVVAKDSHIGQSASRYTQKVIADITVKCRNVIHRPNTLLVVIVANPFALAPETPF